MKNFKDNTMKKKTIIIVMVISLFALMGAYKGGIGEVIGFYGTISNVEGNYIVSNSDAQSAENLYATFYNTVTNQAWDENATAMGSNSTVTHANAAVDCTDARDTPADGWKCDVPSTIRNGWYLLTFYNNATPADTDTILIRRLVNIISGSIQTSDDR